MHCYYFIWCVSCTAVVLTCFVMCRCFGIMCTSIYCVLYCLYCVFVLFRLCIFILICFVRTGVRTTATSDNSIAVNNNNKKKKKKKLRQ
jgi:hypothetical protein